ncbi:protein kinase, partial [Acinetobacter baumannii]
VYLARDPKLKREVALKEMGVAPGADRTLVARFMLEAEVTGSLQHPNIVTIHESLEQDGRPFIAMEYLERGSLRRYVRTLSLAQVAGV